CKERHPIEELEPDLPEPWAGDDGIGPRHERAKIPLELCRRSASQPSTRDETCRTWNESSEAVRHPRSSLRRREAPLRLVPVVERINAERFARVDQQWSTVIAVDRAKALDGLSPTRVDSPVTYIRRSRVLPSRHARAIREERMQAAVGDTHDVVR